MEVQNMSRRSSTVWGHFNKKGDSKNECKYCNALLSTTGGSSGNLKRHLIKKHPTLHLDSKEELKPLIRTYCSPPIPSSSRRSLIWNHFNAIEGSKGECKYCQVVLSITGGSTSNLKRHLKTKHLTIFVESNVEAQRRSLSSLGPSQAASSDSEMEMAEDSITIFCPEVDISTPETVVETDIPESKFSPSPQSSLENLVQVPMYPYVQRDKNVDLQLLKTICKEYHTFSLVEDPEFKKLISLLCPGYHLPSQKTLRQSLLPQVYDELVVKLKQQIGKATAVSLSTNRWTSIDNQNFITITVHYFNKNTTMCSSMLGCIEFNEIHSTNNFSEMLNNFCKDWEVDSKIIAIVTDNTANIVSAVKKSQWKHIYCYAHSINLIVNAGVKPADHIISKFKSLVQYFNKSSHALAILHSTQKQMGFPKLKLKQDVSSIWNSTYDLLLHVFSNQTPIISTLSILENDNFKISADEWVLCEHMIKLLQVFEEVIKEISSGNSVSLPKIIIFTRSLLDYVVSYRKSSNLPNLVVEVCTILEAEIKDKLVQARDHVEFKYEAAFLDPRFKKNAFANDFKKYKHVYDSMIPQIQMLINSEPDRPVISVNSLWTAYDLELASLNDSLDSRDLSIKELETYLAEPLLPRTSDPLVWWEQNKFSYPHLYQLVLKRLCIPASSVPSKHIYLKACQILADEEIELDSSELSQILFLNSNL